MRQVDTTLLDSRRINIFVFLIFNWDQSTVVIVQLQ